ncbi:MAG: hypothetical protein LBM07_05030 [Culturomica sp.]|jgi:FtsZ-binding cell division protein ZapB|nr:hypothetical protein [Culturomica sp.]
METQKKDKLLIYTIIVLGVIMVGLLVFFLVERSKNQKHIAQIHEEKQLLENELSDLSHSYDDLKTTNDTLNEKLFLEQEKISTLMGEMKKFRDNSYAEISRYRKEIGTLKSVLRDYVVQIDSLNQLNQKLTQENTQVKKQSDWLRERNKKLETDKKDMEKVIEIASALTVENFVVIPINKKGREVNWKRCFQLRADFVIPKNITAKRGVRTVYLRIKRPDGQVMAFSENSFFKYQKVSLTYSAKREIEYEGERLETSIYWPNDGSLIKGAYTAELFCDDENIGSTEFVL